MVENGCFFFVCIACELSVHASVDEITADYMGVEVDDGVSILIISFSTTVLLGGSFGFIWCGISTLFPTMNFCSVDFCHQFVYFGSEVLVL